MPIKTKYYKYIVCKCFLLIILSLTGCQDGENDTKKVRTVKDEIRTYSSTLDMESPEGYLTLKSVEETISDQKAYLVTYQTNISPLLTLPLKKGDEATAKNNIEITSKWKEMYCKSSLIAIMRVNKLMLVTAVLEDGDGNRHSYAPCY